MPALDDLRKVVTGFLGTGDSRTKGDQLERFFEELLHELRFEDVRRQRAGLQFGRDFSFRRKERTGYAECKNYERDIKPSDLTDKVVWFPMNPPTDLYAIVSPTPVDNQLHKYLAENQHATTFLDWTGRHFFLVCSQAPKTLEKFCSHTVGQLENAEQELARALVEAKQGAYPPRHELRHSLSHQLVTPFTWVFYRSERGIERAFPLGDTLFRLFISNPNPDEVTLDNFECRVHHISDLPNRLIGWSKLKGIEKPPKVNIKLTPDKYVYTDLLEGSVLKVGGRNMEVIDLDLSGHTANGIYKAELVGRCVSSVGESRFAFEPIPFVVTSDDEMPHQYMGFFGSPRDEEVAKLVLDLEDAKWRQLSRSGKRHDSRYLSVDLKREKWVAGNGLVDYELAPFAGIPELTAEQRDEIERDVRKEMDADAAERSGGTP